MIHTIMETNMCTNLLVVESLIVVVVVADSRILPLQANSDTYISPRTEVPV